MATMSDTIEEYLKYRRSRQKENTVTNDAVTLRKMLAIIGNIQVSSIDARHMDQFFAERATKLKPNSMNTCRAQVSAYFEWCRSRKYMPANNNPLAGHRRQVVAEVPHLRIPVSDFERVLTAATHPRDRIIVAIGLYLCIRGGEVRTLKVRDVDFDAGTIAVTVHKSQKYHEMTMPEELEDELRLWLTHLTEVLGPPQPDWYLCCAKNSPVWTSGPGGKPIKTGAGGGYKPHKATYRVWGAAQRTLEAAGYPLRGDDGESLREGCHTLRRSGARALHDRLMADGHVDAIRQVQSRLHHKKQSQTEEYIGLDPDRVKVDEWIRGRRLYPKPDQTNVVHLAVAK